MFLLFALKKKIIFQFFLFFVCGSADITLPQNIRQSLRSLPNDSQFPLQPQENQSSMVKEKKKAVKKHVCPEQGCPKSITGYTQSHNLKDHMRKKHNSM